MTSWLTSNSINSDLSSYYRSLSRIIEPGILFNSQNVLIVVYQGVILKTKERYKLQDVERDIQICTKYKTAFQTSVLPVLHDSKYATVSHLDRSTVFSGLLIRQLTFHICRKFLIRNYIILKRNSFLSFKLFF